MAGPGERIAAPPGRRSFRADRIVAPPGSPVLQGGSHRNDAVTRGAIGGIIE